VLQQHFILEDAVAIPPDEWRGHDLYRGDRRDIGAQQLIRSTGDTRRALITEEGQHVAVFEETGHGTGRLKALGIGAPPTHAQYGASVGAEVVGVDPVGRVGVRRWRAQRDPIDVRPTIPAVHLWIVRED